jgi:hypothetical protein
LRTGDLKTSAGWAYDLTQEIHMASAIRRNARLSPRASRPQIPDYGIAKSRKGLLPWKWAEQHLKKSRQYWIATTRPNGSPHVMIIWGVWLDDGFYFSTGKHSRKARNLAANRRCVICNENSAQAVIVEGEAEIVRPEILKPIFAAYKRKYKMDISGMDEPLFRVRPSTVFGLIEKKFAGSATRWKFLG